jgi:DNA polymerase
VANVFRFRPPENKVRHFFQTTKEAALSGNSRAADYGRHAHGFCRAEYLSEIEHLAATLRFASAVLALGAVPLWITTGRQSVTENAGLSLPCRLADLPVFPTYHPAFILRGNRGLIPEWQAAMHRAARFAELTHRQPERIEP